MRSFRFWYHKYMSAENEKKVRCRNVTSDGYGEAEEVAVSNLQFRPSVYGVIVKEGKVLLVPQWDGYDFPGGGIDEGERIAEALVREVKEETGMDAVSGELLLVTDDFFLHPKSGKAFHSILMYYTADTVGGELSTDGFSEFEKTIAQKAEWIDIETACGLKFYNPVDSPALIRKAAVMQ
jgi:8-oxo-dGTP diphosphatase